MIKMDFSQIQLVISDVDGTLTDGSVYYDQNGNEIKKFSVKDGAGFNIAKAAGLKIMLLTGRSSIATKRRGEELNLDYIYQGVRDKPSFLIQFMKENNYKKENMCYIGDDINDLRVMSLCGYVCCPADASIDVKCIADYISPVPGGHGAVRDSIEHILRKKGSWGALLSSIESNRI